jgi:penicillin-binding protein 1A
MAVDRWGIVPNFVDWLTAMLCSVVARVALSQDWLVLQERLHSLCRDAYVTYDTKRFHKLKKALVLAEDRRFYCHHGLDTRAMVRALWSYVAKREVQGASTITQQLVRVLTGRYDRKLSRKCREIMLACLVDRELPKQVQINCYLKVAYFGWRMNGIKQALSRLQYLAPLSDKQAAQVIARLKYPEPQAPSPALQLKIASRAAYIEQLLSAYRKRD